MTKLTPRARDLRAGQLVRLPKSRPAPTGERPQGLCRQLRPHEHLDAIRHQLRQELGREPTPQEIRARFETQWEPTDFGQMLTDGVREMLGPLPERPPSRWHILVRRLLHPWRAVPVARTGRRP
jgi:hypothetical protein